MRGRRHRHSRSHHARAVRPRRLYRCRCSRRRRHARRLRHRASALRHDAKLHRALLCPRRHADPGQGSAARRRGEHRAESRADGAAGAGRPCAGDERRRLDQSDAAHHLRPAAGFRRIRRRTSPGDTASACRRGARRRALFRQPLAEQGLRRAPLFPRGDHACGCCFSSAPSSMRLPCCCCSVAVGSRSLLKDVGTAADAPASKTPQPPDPTSASSSLPDSTPPPTV